MENESAYFSSFAAAITKNNGNGKDLSKEEKFKKNYGDYILNKTTKWHKKTNNEGHICSRHYFFALLFTEQIIF